MRCAWLALVLGTLVACRQDDRSSIVPGASIAAGRSALQQYGCGACHEIHGIPGAHGRVGPPLDGLRERVLIAGQIPNSVDNMAGWIREPQRYVPGTGMPNLGVNDSTARNMVAYIYQLR